MRLASLAILGGTIIVLTGCDKTSPGHDQAPIIREQIGKLYTALHEQNLTALDSLVSGDLTDDGLSLDSLVSFVWGRQGEKRFDHFGPSEIIYNKKKARVDCSLVDSSGNSYLNVTWTLVNENETWLLKRFETGVRPIDSTL